MVKFQSRTGSLGFPACEGTQKICKKHDEGPATVRKWMNQKGVVNIHRITNNFYVKFT